MRRVLSFLRQQVRTVFVCRGLARGCAGRATLGGSKPEPAAASAAATARAAATNLHCFRRSCRRVGRPGALCWPPAIRRCHRLVWRSAVFCLNAGPDTAVPDAGLAIARSSSSACSAAQCCRIQSRSAVFCSFGLLLLQSLTYCRELRRLSSRGTVVRFARQRSRSHA